MRLQWSSKPLEELCEFRNGLWQSKKPPYVHVGVIRNTNFTKSGLLDDSDIAYLDVEEKQFAKRQLKFGDLILEKSGGGPKQPVGRVIGFEKTEGLFSFSNFTSVIRVIDPTLLSFRFLHRLLYWYYSSGVTEGMQRRSTGIRNLDFKAYKQLQIPLPPLPEQARIVAILDEVFAAIATATAHAEKNLANAQELFERLVQDACSGAVTKDAHEALAGPSATTLIDAANDYRVKHWRGQRKYTEPVGIDTDKAWQVPSHWLLASLDSICALFVDSAHRTPKYIDSGIPALRPRDVVGGMLSMERVARVSNEEYGKQTKRYKPQPGDLVYSRELSYGWAAEIEDEVQICLSQGMCVFRLAPGFSRSFLIYFLNGPMGRAQAKDVAVGTAHPHVNIRDIKAYAIPVPPPKEQVEIASRLDEIALGINVIRENLDSKLSLLTTLKRSLLHKAFTGELTANNKIADRTLAEANV